MTSNMLRLLSHAIEHPYYWLICGNDARPSVNALVARGFVRWENAKKTHYRLDIPVPNEEDVQNMKDNAL